MSNPLDPIVFAFVGYLFISWFAGYCLGVASRFIRQIFEKASRT